MFDTVRNLYSQALEVVKKIYNFKVKMEAFVEQDSDI